MPTPRNAPVARSLPGDRGPEGAGRLRCPEDILAFEQPPTDVSPTLRRPKIMADATWTCRRGRARGPSTDPERRAVIGVEEEWCDTGWRSCCRRAIRPRASAMSFGLRASSQGEPAGAEGLFQDAFAANDALTFRQGRESS